MYDLSAEARAVASDECVSWDLLSGKRVLVTGATGLVGSACARALLERNRMEADPLPVNVVVLARDEARLWDALDGYGPDDGVEVILGSVEDVPLEAVAADFYIHAACPTASKFFMAHPVQTADAIVLGTRRLLEAAKDSNALGFAYISSMEVYGDGNEAAGLDELLGEDDVGYVDPLSVRSCYPEGKRMAEQYVAAYASQYGMRAFVVRLAQTFGPGIPKDDSRIFAMIARNAMNGEDVTLRTTGESTRMYSYISDAVRAILCVLTRGQSGSAYNVANPETYSSVRGMAEDVLNEFTHGANKVVFDIDPDAPFPPEHHLPLDVSRIRELGWEPTVGLVEMYGNLVEYLKED